MEGTRPLDQPNWQPMGNIEPHAGLLKAPADGQLLYKVMSIENLLRSMSDGYLHFNRVDSYRDGDRRDGRQLAKDEPLNEAVRFDKAPDFSVATYYDQARSRTYACCFSLENTRHIWDEYGVGSAIGKACIVFDFSKLRLRLNASLSGAALLADGEQCLQIFDLNYGVVEYVDWESHRANGERLPNPIQYAFMKDMGYQDDRELRISLSALGIGYYMVGGRTMDFRPSLHLSFDHRGAIADGTIREILFAPESASAYVREELGKLRIVASGT